MTFTQSPSDIFTQVMASARRLGGMLARAGFGFFVVFAAGAALVATTIIGLLIAVAALFLNLAQRVARGGGVKSEPRAKQWRERDPGFKGKSTTSSAAGGETLDARRTPDGWVIEPDA